MSRFILCCNDCSVVFETTGDRITVTVQPDDGGDDMVSSIGFESASELFLFLRKFLLKSSELKKMELVREALSWQ